MREWRALLESRATRLDKPMKPQAVAWYLGPLLADDAICITDSGTITAWWARYVRARRGQMFNCSGLLSTMGCGVPYAVGAQIAHPGRQVVAFVGDGGFSTLMAEFATLVKYNLPVKVIVIKNNTLGQIKWEQLVYLGNPEYGCELQPIDFAKVAEACGGVGLRVEDPAELPEKLLTLLRAEVPALLEAVVDPFEPPWPPSLKPELAAHVAEAMAKGEPNRGRLALTLFRDQISDLSAGSGPLSRLAEKVGDMLKKEK